MSRKIVHIYMAVDLRNNRIANLIGDLNASTSKEAAE
jgi:hypothetical protein